VHIDKKKKFPASALLRAFGYGTDEELYALFYDTREVTLTAAHFTSASELMGSVISREIFDEDSGEILFEHGTEITDEVLARLERAGIKTVEVYAPRKASDRGYSPIVKRTIQRDPTDSEESALFAIYSLLRPGEAPNVETARQALERVFFNPKRYDLGRVGRYKINQRLGSQGCPEAPRCSPGTTSSPSSATSSICPRGGASRTTSTTSGTAASAPWAS
jgi:DNA-directed RNA polymerase subunit beta